ncbi:MAG TPA: glycoside hydrolase family 6 protein [Solirubrobacteraceae bacterium]
MSASSARRLLVVAAICLSALVGLAPTASAGVANASLPGASAANPLKGLPWGVYRGPVDNIYTAYQSASGPQRALLARIALRPLMFWFGVWYDDSSAQNAVSQYISDVTRGNPNVLVQIAVFRLQPWEGASCRRLASPAEQASYKRWIDRFAAGIGPTRVAMVLQPDLPFAFCNPDGGRIALSLVSYAARVFNALPHTSVYIDAGAADWYRVGQTVSMLRRAGITGVRGFSLNNTHFDSNSNELRFGARVSRALAAAGVPGKHFVINTAENGSGWAWQQYHGDHGNPRVCRTAADWPCETLGIPPTTNVTDPRLHLSRAAARAARRWCDAYLWVGRPWLDNGAWPFDLTRTLALARSTPFP